MNGNGNLTVPGDQPSDPRRLARLQALTVSLLFAGYAAYYFCRSDFSVAMPMLIDELHGRGMALSDATIQMGTIASVGVLAYAIGKLLLGGLGDLWGGRRSFLAGMTGAVIFTLVFAFAGGIPVFTVAWIGNRLIQSTGWPGLVKVCSRWFSYTSYGRVVGFLSLSFLVGDAAARQSMGMLISHGYGWRSLFFYAAAVAALILLANVALLRESRESFGFEAPEVNPLNAFAIETSGMRPRSLGALLRPLLADRGFWIVCFLSLGTTIIRETFNLWTPTYLRNHLGYNNANAAGISAIFPAVGAVSVLAAGWAGDRLGANGRSIILLFGMLLTTLGLWLLTTVHSGVHDAFPLLLIGTVGFGLLGPYSYLAGAMALDFGGSQGGATSSGIIDGVGYLGGVLAGASIARLSVAFGWGGAFAALAGVSAASALGAGCLFLYQRKEALKRNLTLRSKLMDR